MKIVRLVIRYLFDFILANFAVAKQVLSPRMEIEPEVIELESHVKSHGEVLVLANLISFTPGTLTLVIDPGSERLVVHVLSGGDEAAAAIRENLEAPLLAITRRHEP